MGLSTCSPDRPVLHHERCAQLVPVCAWGVQKRGVPWKQLLWLLVLQLLQADAFDFMVEQSRVLRLRQLAGRGGHDILAWHSGNGSGSACSEWIRSSLASTLVTIHRSEQVLSSDDKYSQAKT